jgi:hypothetical protein
VDRTWKLKLEGTAAPRLRSSAGKTELLAPVRFTDGQARIVETFVW